MQLNQKLAIRYIRARINILSLVSPRKAAIKAFRIFCTPRERNSKKGSALFEKGEALSFRLQGHTVRGHRWIPSHEADPAGKIALPALAPKKVLIAHGFQSASRNFEHYVEALTKKGVEVIAFDAPAHGLSGGRRIVLPDYIRMLKIIEANYGPFHSYLGHSLGGLALALFLEDTPHDNNTRLALVAPAVEMSSAVATFGSILHLSPDVLREMDVYVQEIEGHPFAWYSLRRALHQVKATVHYFQDEEDRITPLKETGGIRQDHQPNVHFVFTKGLGHRRIYKDPEVMDKIVTFLL